MKKQPISNLLITIILGALMLVWIFVTVALTGGREIYEFTHTDKIIFTCFVITEILTVIFIFIFALRAGKNNEKININNPLSNLKPKERRVANFRASLILILSLVMGMASVFAGIFLQKFISDIYAYFGFAIAITITVLIFVLNVVLQRAYTKRLDRRSVEDAQAFMLSHRENAEKTSREKADVLRKIRTATVLPAVLTL